MSGRGVGMDVVRTNIEKSVERLIDSIEGEGTVVSIKIPLTLAIVSAISNLRERFDSTIGCSRAGYGVDRKIEMIKGSPVFRLRDHLLPLVY